MEKFIAFILCVVAIIIGVAGTIVEVNRMVTLHQAMTDDAWLGNVVITCIYATMAIGAATYIVKLCKKH